MAFATGVPWIAGASVAAAVALAIGCARASADSGDAAETPHVSAENAVSFSLAKHHLAAVRADLAAGADSSMHCGSLLPLLPPLKSEPDDTVKRFEREAEQTCAYDAPLAWGRANVSQLEAGASSAAPCVHLEGALASLRGAHGADAAVLALDASYRRFCGG